MSFGGKNAGLSLNSRSGARARLSAPGTGFSYSTKIGVKNTSSSKASASKQRISSNQQQEMPVLNKYDAYRATVIKNNLTEKSAKKFQNAFIVISAISFIIGIPTCVIPGVGAIFLIIGCVAWYFAIQYGRIKKYIKQNPNIALQPANQTCTDYIPMQNMSADNVIANHEKYSKCSATYFDGLEELESMWSVMYNLKITTGEKADAFEAKCKDNINDLYKMLNIGRKCGYDSTMPPRVPAYVRLAMIYEKQERYQDAINICAEAIKAGAINDGSKGKMYGRLARLIKKSGSNVSDDLLALSIKQNDLNTP